MTQYQTHITEITVVPLGSPLICESATIVGVDDESGGPYLTIRQPAAGRGDGVRIDLDEWPAVRAALNAMADHARGIGLERPD